MREFDSCIVHSESFFSSFTDPLLESYQFVPVEAFSSVYMCRVQGFVENIPMTRPECFEFILLIAMRSFSPRSRLLAWLSHTFSQSSHVTERCGKSGVLLCAESKHKAMEAREDEGSFLPSSDPSR